MDHQTATALLQVIQRETGLDNPTNLLNFIEQKFSDKPKNLTIKQFCQQLPCSRATVDKYIGLKKIKTIRVGRRVLIPSDEFNRIALEGLQ